MCFCLDVDPDSKNKMLLIFQLAPINSIVKCLVIRGSKRNSYPYIYRDYTWEFKRKLSRIQMRLKPQLQQR